MCPRTQEVRIFLSFHYFPFMALTFFFLRGKHTRQFGQLKASGREVATSFLAIFRVENGKIVEVCPLFELLYFFLFFFSLTLTHRDGSITTTLAL